MAESADKVLHLDILTLILRRLPAKSLLKFKSVSKYWFSLISSRYFTKHLLQNSRRLFLISEINDNPKLCNSVLLPSPNIVSTAEKVQVRYSFDDNKYPLKFSFSDDKPMHVVGSCNGLVCLVDSVHHGSFIVCNPATRKSRPILYRGSCLVRLDISFLAYGFGYDAANNDYKIVIVIKHYLWEQQSVEIYSLKSESWKLVVMPHNAQVDDKDLYTVDAHDHGTFLMASHGVFANGALHFQGKFPEVDNNDKLFLIALDMQGNSCSLLDIPDHECSKDSLDVDVKLGTSRSERYICIAHIYKDHINIWILKDLWTKVACLSKFAFECAYVKGIPLRADERMNNFYSLLHQVLLHRGFVRLLSLEDGEIFMKYNKSSKVGQLLSTRESGHWFCDYYMNFGFIICRESLISPYLS